MFERYNEKARRVIFFARYNASQDGDTYIRCVHLLGGIERENGALLREAGLSAERVRELCASDDLFQRGKHRISVSVDVPLDESAKRALLLATEAANHLQSKFIEPVHIFWAIYHADPKLKEKLVALDLTEEKLTGISQKYSGTEAQGRFEDVRMADYALPHARSGIGYDLHRLAEGRKLILGGVEVPFEKGPVGHSDGDVLAHAICDALLGAAGLGDIGTHFPDSNPKWKDASSLTFLQHVRALLEVDKLKIVHLDAVVVAERPKLGPHFPAMRDALAKALGIDPGQINLKAKTNEGVDAIGRGEAIAAHAIATLES